MSNGVDVVILAEDKRHQMLIHKHLRKRGYTHHKIRICPWWPQFQTPCLSFVKDEYPKQVQALRRKSYRVMAALITVVDADDATVEQRLEELDALLAASGGDKRGPNEPIAIVVARRNIETWMHFLNGNVVDEETDYKPQCRALDNRAIATQFAHLSWPHRELSENCPPSLRYACEVELRRLPD